MLHKAMLTVLINTQTYTQIDRDASVATAHIYAPSACDAD